MECRADGANGLAVAVGPGPIGQQNDRQLALKVDPQRSARIAKVAS
jgi:hypothetical protein